MIETKETLENSYFRDQEQADLEAYLDRRERREAYKSMATEASVEVRDLFEQLMRGVKDRIEIMAEIDLLLDKAETDINVEGVSTVATEIRSDNSFGRGLVHLLSLEAFKQEDDQVLANELKRIFKKTTELKSMSAKRYNFLLDEVRKLKDDREPNSFISQFETESNIARNGTAKIQAEQIVIAMNREFKIHTGVWKTLVQEIAEALKAYALDPTDSDLIRLRMSFLKFD